MVIDRTGKDRAAKNPSPTSVESTEIVMSTLDRPSKDHRQHINSHDHENSDQLEEGSNSTMSTRSSTTPYHRKSNHQPPPPSDASVSSHSNSVYSSGSRGAEGRNRSRRAPQAPTPASRAKGRRTNQPAKRTKSHSHVLSSKSHTGAMSQNIVTQPINRRKGPTRPGLDRNGVNGSNLSSRWLVDKSLSFKKNLPGRASSARAPSMPGRRRALDSDDESDVGSPTPDIRSKSSVDLRRQGFGRQAMDKPKKSKNAQSTSSPRKSEALRVPHRRSQEAIPVTPVAPATPASPVTPTGGEAAVQKPFKPKRQFQRSKTFDASSEGGTGGKPFVRKRFQPARRVQRCTSDSEEPSESGADPLRPGPSAPAPAPAPPPAPAPVPDEEAPVVRKPFKPRRRRFSDDDEQNSSTGRQDPLRSRSTHVPLTQRIRVEDELKSNSDHGADGGVRRKNEDAPPPFRKRFVPKKRVIRRTTSSDDERADAAAKLAKEKAEAAKAEAARSEAAKAAALDGQSSATEDAAAADEPTAPARKRFVPKKRIIPRATSDSEEEETPARMPEEPKENAATLEPAPQKSPEEDVDEPRAPVRKRFVPKKRNTPRATSDSEEDEEVSTLMPEQPKESEPTIQKSPEEDVTVATEPPGRKKFVPKKRNVPRAMSDSEEEEPSANVPEKATGSAVTVEPAVQKPSEKDDAVATEPPAPARKRFVPKKRNIQRATSDSEEEETSAKMPEQAKEDSVPVEPAVQKPLEEVAAVATDQPAGKRFVPKKREIPRATSDSEEEETSPTMPEQAKEDSVPFEAAAQKSPEENVGAPEPPVQKRFVPKKRNMPRALSESEEDESAANPPEQRIEDAVTVDPDLQKAPEEDVAAATEPPAPVRKRFVPKKRNIPRAMSDSEEDEPQANLPDKALEDSVPVELAAEKSLEDVAAGAEPPAPARKKFVPKKRNVVRATSDSEEEESSAKLPEQAMEAVAPAEEAVQKSPEEDFAVAPPAPARKKFVPKKRNIVRATSDSEEEESSANQPEPATNSAAPAELALKKPPEEDIVAASEPPVPARKKFVPKKRNIVRATSDSEEEESPANLSEQPMEETAAAEPAIQKSREEDIVDAPEPPAPARKKFVPKKRNIVRGTSDSEEEEPSGNLAEQATKATDNLEPTVQKSPKPDVAAVEPPAPARKKFVPKRRNVVRATSDSNEEELPAEQAKEGSVPAEGPVQKLLEEDVVAGAETPAPARKKFVPKKGNVVRATSDSDEEALPAKMPEQATEGSVPAEASFQKSLEEDVAAGAEPPASAGKKFVPKKRNLVRTTSDSEEEDLPSNLPEQPMESAGLPVQKSPEGDVVIAAESPAPARKTVVPKKRNIIRATSDSEEEGDSGSERQDEQEVKADVQPVSAISTPPAVSPQKPVEEEHAQAVLEEYSESHEGMDDFPAPDNSFELGIEAAHARANEHSGEQTRATVPSFSAGRITGQKNRSARHVEEAMPNRFHIPAFRPKKPSPFRRCETSDIVNQHRYRRPTVLVETDIGSEFETSESESSEDEEESNDKFTQDDEEVETTKDDQAAAATTEPEVPVPRKRFVPKKRNRGRSAEDEEETDDTFNDDSTKVTTNITSARRSSQLASAAVGMPYVHLPDAKDFLEEESTEPNAGDDAGAGEESSPTTEAAAYANAAAASATRAASDAVTAAATAVAAVANAARGVSAVRDTRPIAAESERTIEIIFEPSSCSTGFPDDSETIREESQVGASERRGSSQRAETAFAMENSLLQPSPGGGVTDAHGNDDAPVSRKPFKPRKRNADNEGEESARANKTDDPNANVSAMDKTAGDGVPSIMDAGEQARANRKDSVPTLRRIGSVSDISTDDDDDDAESEEAEINETSDDDIAALSLTSESAIDSKASDEKSLSRTVEDLETKQDDSRADGSAEKHDSSLSVPTERKADEKAGKPRSQVPPVITSSARRQSSPSQGDQQADQKSSPLDTQPQQTSGMMMRAPARRRGSSSSEASQSEKPPGSLESAEPTSVEASSRHRDSGSYEKADGSTRRRSSRGMDSSQRNRGMDSSQQNRDMDSSSRRNRGMDSSQQNRSKDSSSRRNRGMDSSSRRRGHRPSSQTNAPPRRGGAESDSPDEAPKRKKFTPRKAGSSRHLPKDSPDESKSSDKTPRGIRAPRRRYSSSDEESNEAEKPSMQKSTTEAAGPAPQRRGSKEGEDQAPARKPFTPRKESARGLGSGAPRRRGSDSEEEDDTARKPFSPRKASSRRLGGSDSRWGGSGSDEEEGKTTGRKPFTPRKLSANDAGASSRGLGASVPRRRGSDSEEEETPGRKAFTPRKVSSRALDTSTQQRRGSRSEEEDEAPERKPFGQREASARGLGNSAPQRKGSESDEEEGAPARKSFTPRKVGGLGAPRRSRADSDSSDETPKRTDNLLGDNSRARRNTRSARDSSPQKEPQRRVAPQRTSSKSLRVTPERATSFSRMAPGRRSMGGEQDPNSVTVLQRDTGLGRSAPGRAVSMSAAGLSSLRVQRMESNTGLRQMASAVKKDEGSSVGGKSEPQRRVPARAISAKGLRVTPERSTSLRRQVPGRTTESQESQGEVTFLERGGASAPGRSAPLRAASMNLSALRTAPERSTSGLGMRSAAGGGVGGRQGAVGGLSAMSSRGAPMRASSMSVAGQRRTPLRTASSMRRQRLAEVSVPAITEESDSNLSVNLNDSRSEFGMQSLPALPGRAEFSQPSSMGNFSGQSLSSLPTHPSRMAPQRTPSSLRRQRLAEQSVAPISEDSDAVMSPVRRAPARTQSSMRRQMLAEQSVAPISEESESMDTPLSQPMRRTPARSPSSLRREALAQQSVASISEESDDADTPLSMPARRAPQRTASSMRRQRLSEQSVAPIREDDDADDTPVAPMRRAPARTASSMRRQMLAQQSVAPISEESDSVDTPLSQPMRRTPSRTPSSLRREALAQHSVAAISEESEDADTPLSQPVRRAPQRTASSMRRQRLAEQSVAPISEDDDADDTPVAPMRRAPARSASSMRRQMLAQQSVAPISEESEDGDTPLSQPVRRAPQRTTSSMRRQMLAERSVAPISEEADTLLSQPMRRAPARTPSSLRREVLADQSVAPICEESEDEASAPSQPIRRAPQRTASSMRRQMIAEQSVAPISEDSEDPDLPMRSSSPQRGASMGLGSARRTPMRTASSLRRQNLADQSVASISEEGAGDEPPSMASQMALMSSSPSMPYGGRSAPMRAASMGFTPQRKAPMRTVSSLRRQALAEQSVAPICEDEEDTGEEAPAPSRVTPLRAASMSLAMKNSRSLQGSMRNSRSLQSSAPALPSRSQEPQRGAPGRTISSKILRVTPERSVSGLRRQAPGRKVDNSTSQDGEVTVLQRAAPGAGSGRTAPLRAASMNLAAMGRRASGGTVGGMQRKMPMAGRDRGTDGEMARRMQDSDAGSRATPMRAASMSLAAMGRRAPPGRTISSMIKRPLPGEQPQQPQRGVPARTISGMMRRPGEAPQRGAPARTISGMRRPGETPQRGAPARTISGMRRPGEAPQRGAPARTISTRGADQNSRLAPMRAASMNLSQMRRIASSVGRAGDTPDSPNQQEPLGGFSAGNGSLLNSATGSRAAPVRAASMSLAAMGRRAPPGRTISGMMKRPAPGEQPQQPQRGVPARTISGMMRRPGEAPQRGAPARTISGMMRRPGEAPQRGAPARTISGMRRPGETPQRGAPARTISTRGDDRNSRLAPMRAASMNLSQMRRIASSVGRPEDSPASAIGQDTQTRTTGADRNSRLAPMRAASMNLSQMRKIASSVGRPQDNTVNTDQREPPSKRLPQRTISAKGVRAAPGRRSDENQVEEGEASMLGQNNSLMSAGTMQQVSAPKNMPSRTASVTLKNFRRRRSAETPALEAALASARSQAKPSRFAAGGTKSAAPAPYTAPVSSRLGTGGTTSVVPGPSRQLPGRTPSSSVGRGLPARSPSGMISRGGTGMQRQTPARAQSIGLGHAARRQLPQRTSSSRLRMAPGRTPSSSLQRIAPVQTPTDSRATPQTSQPLQGLRGHQEPARILSGSEGGSKPQRFPRDSAAEAAPGRAAPKRIDSAPKAVRSRPSVVAPEAGDRETGVGGNGTTRILKTSSSDSLQMDGLALGRLDDVMEGSKEASQFYKSDFKISGLQDDDASEKSSSEDASNSSEETLDMDFPTKTEDIKANAPSKASTASRQRSSNAGPPRRQTSESSSDANDPATSAQETAEVRAVPSKPEIARRQMSRNAGPPKRQTSDSSIDKEDVAIRMQEPTEASTPPTKPSMATRQISRNAGPPRRQTSESSIDPEAMSTKMQESAEGQQASSIPRLANSGNQGPPKRQNSDSSIDVEPPASKLQELPEDSQASSKHSIATRQTNHNAGPPRRQTSESSIDPQARKMQEPAEATLASSQPPIAISGNADPPRRQNSDSSNDVTDPTAALQGPGETTPAAARPPITTGNTGPLIRQNSDSVEVNSSPTVPKEAAQASRDPGMPATVTKQMNRNAGPPRRRSSESSIDPEDLTTKLQKTADDSAVPNKPPIATGQISRNAGPPKRHNSDSSTEKQAPAAKIPMPTEASAGSSKPPTPTSSNAGPPRRQNSDSSSIREDSKDEMEADSPVNGAGDPQTAKTQRNPPTALGQHQIANNEAAGGNAGTPRRQNSDASEEENPSALSLPERPSVANSTQPSSSNDDTLTNDSELSGSTETVAQEAKMPTIQSPPPSKPSIATQQTIGSGKTGPPRRQNSESSSCEDRGFGKDSGVVQKRISQQTMFKAPSAPTRRSSIDVSESADMDGSVREDVGNAAPVKTSNHGSFPSKENEADIGRQEILPVLRSETETAMQPVPKPGGQPVKPALSNKKGQASAKSGGKNVSFNVTNDRMVGASAPVTKAAISNAAPPRRRSSCASQTEDEEDQLNGQSAAKNPTIDSLGEGPSQKGLAIDQSRNDTGDTAQAQKVKFDLVIEESEAGKDTAASKKSGDLKLRLPKRRESVEVGSSVGAGIIRVKHEGPSADIAPIPEEKKSPPVGIAFGMNARPPARRESVPNEEDESDSESESDAEVDYSSVGDDESDMPPLSDFASVKDDESMPPLDDFGSVKDDESMPPLDDMLSVRDDESMPPLDDATVREDDESMPPLDDATSVRDDESCFTRDDGLSMKDDEDDDYSMPPLDDATLKDEESIANMDDATSMKDDDSMPPLSDVASASVRDDESMPYDDETVKEDDRSKSVSAHEEDNEGESKAENDGESHGVPPVINTCILAKQRIGPVGVTPEDAAVAAAVPPVIDTTISADQVFKGNRKTESAGDDKNVKRHVTDKETHYADITVVNPYLVDAKTSSGTAQQGQDDEKHAEGELKPVTIGGKNEGKKKSPLKSALKRDDKKLGTEEEKDQSKAPGATEASKDGSNETTLATNENAASKPKAMFNRWG